LTGGGRERKVAVEGLRERMEGEGRKTDEKEIFRGREERGERTGRCRISV